MLSNHLQRELDHIQANAVPYIPFTERFHPNVPGNYPYPVDVAHVAWNAPIEAPVPSMDPNLYFSEMSSGFKRQSWEDAMAYANSPAWRGGHATTDIASIAGHRNGLVGVYHNQLSAEQDPQWGGGGKK